MEAKKIEVSALLRAGHKKSEIAKRLKVSRMTVHQVADRLRNSETLEDRPCSGRPQVIKRETVRKAFEDYPALKMTKLAEKEDFCGNSVRGC